MVLTTATSPFAHRVDEYLQATTLLVSKGRLQLELRLAPGVAVVSTVLDSLDTNRDGAISDAEGRAYGARVLRNLTVMLDNEVVPLRLTSWRSGTVDEMQRGQGDMELVFAAALPGASSRRKLVVENSHRSAISTYLVNALVPEDRDIRIASQTRNYRQSVYEMVYEQAGTGARAVSVATALGWLLAFGVLAMILGDTLMSRRRRAADVIVTASARVRRGTRGSPNE